ncbi:alpha/beta hydrolase [Massilia cavernae]|nr:alpha/beta fold hydrolase [Massilia cavernae]
MVKTSVSRLLVGTVFFLASRWSFALPASPLEESVCGSFTEWFSFRMWSSLAGKPDTSAFRRMSNVEEISHVTIDNRTLRGYRINSATPSKGSVLFAQGNAMLADQVLQSLSQVVDAGFDVVVFDYRGYGQSDGKPRLKAIVSDYVEIANAMAKAQPKKLYFYGVSFGGVVLLNTLAAVPPVSGTVIDSSPGTVSDLGCPSNFDPITHIPDNAGSILVVIGDRDRVVLPSKSAGLARKVVANGGHVMRRPDFSHPFMDPDNAVASTRLNIAIDFFNSK